MSLKLVRAAAAAEQDDSLHLARLLLLLLHASSRGDGTINGITKIAKMDFLLRYPQYFVRLLDEISDRPVEVPMKPYEVDTVESKMIRFKYGPWDPRYRRWIGLLAAKGLADTFRKGNTVYVRLTEKGKQVSGDIAGSVEFVDLDARATLIGKKVCSMSGTRLKNLVYKVVPEITGMSWGEKINP
jgi:hypothetical protein